MKRLLLILTLVLVPAAAEAQRLYQPYQPAQPKKIERVQLTTIRLPPHEITTGYIGTRRITTTTTNLSSTVSMTYGTVRARTGDGGRVHGLSKGGYGLGSPKPYYPVSALPQRPGRR